MDIENLKVKKVHYSYNQITKFMLTDGRIVNLDQMLHMINNNEIIGYTIGYSKDNKPFVRSMPDLGLENNLNNLETF